MANKKQKGVAPDKTARPVGTDLRRGVKLLRTIQASEETVRGVAFDPTGRMLASSSDDKKVKVRPAHRGRYSALPKEGEERRF